MPIFNFPYVTCYIDKLYLISYLAPVKKQTHHVMCQKELSTSFNIRIINASMQSSRFFYFLCNIVTLTNLSHILSCTRNLKKIYHVLCQKELSTSFNIRIINASMQSSRFIFFYRDIVTLRKFISYLILHPKSKKTTS